MWEIKIYKTQCEEYSSLKHNVRNKDLKNTMWGI